MLERRLRSSDLRAVVDDGGGAGKGGRKSVESIIAQTKLAGTRRRIKLPDDELAMYLVDRFGFDLLQSRELRYRLALRATDDELDQLHDYQNAAHSRGGRLARAKKIAERTWHPAKSWSRHFVRVLDFPVAFSGLPGAPKEADLLQVYPFRPLPDLREFQRELMDQAMDVLSGTRGANRGVLTMPTGAGKTRTAVESLLAWLIQQNERPAIMWVAQSEELCEQAVQAFREVWVDYGHRLSEVREGIQIARFWGNATMPEDSDIVVASIQKLYKVVSEESSEKRDELTELAGRIGAIVVDEAHRMQAKSYRDVLQFLGTDPTSSSPIPLLGLTATPFRSNSEETRHLAESFHGRLFTAASLGNDMVSALRQKRVLAEPDHVLLEYDGAEFAMDSNESFAHHYDQFNDFHPGFLREVGQSEERNRALLDCLLKLPAEWPTLFFGCTVEQAVAMALLLRRAGRPAEAVISDTRSATRRSLIEEFRAKRLSVLCNYGVLTTGFDAPQVRALVVGRPTTSRVLYEQMIGRGMRGPEFGGTERCTVVDVRDNIRFHGKLAFTQYSGYWTHEQ